MGCGAVSSDEFKPDRKDISAHEEAAPLLTQMRTGSGRGKPASRVVVIRLGWKTLFSFSLSRTTVNWFGLGIPNENFGGETKNPHAARNASTTNIVFSVNTSLWATKACHDRAVAYLHRASDASSQPGRHAIFSQPPPPVSTMDTNTQRPKGRDGTLSTLNVTIDALNIAKDVVDIAPAKAAFGSVVALLTMIRVRFFLFCDDGLQVHTYISGLDGEPAGLRHSRVELCRYLQSP
jgi:hypothetical protein